MLMVQVGDRIEVTGVLPNDPAPLDVGSRGVVTYVNVLGSTFDYVSAQISVRWDDGRSLMLLGTDPWRIVRKGWTMNDINSVEDLRSLPPRAVVVDHNLKVWQKQDDDSWKTVGDDGSYGDDAIRLGARTLW